MAKVYHKHGIKLDGVAPSNEVGNGLKNPLKAVSKKPTEPPPPLNIENQLNSSKDSLEAKEILERFGRLRADLIEIASKLSPAYLTITKAVIEPITQPEFLYRALEFRTHIKNDPNTIELQGKLSKIINFVTRGTVADIIFDTSATASTREEIERSNDEFKKSLQVALPAIPDIASVRKTLPPDFTSPQSVATPAIPDIASVRKTLPPDFSAPHSVPEQSPPVAAEENSHEPVPLNLVRRKATDFNTSQAIPSVRKTLPPDFSAPHSVPEQSPPVAEDTGENDNAPFALTRSKGTHVNPAVTNAEQHSHQPLNQADANTGKPKGLIGKAWAWFRSRQEKPAHIHKPKATSTWRSRVAVGILSFFGMSGTAQELKPQAEPTQAITQTAPVPNSVERINEPSAEPHTNNEDNQLNTYPSSSGSVSAGLRNLADANIHTGIYDSLHTAGADMWQAIYGKTALGSNTRDALAENLAWRISHAPALANFHVGRDYSKKLTVSFQGRDTNNNGIFAVTMDNMTVNVAVVIPNIDKVVAHSEHPRDFSQNQIDTAYTHAKNEVERFSTMINPGLTNPPLSTSQSVNGPYQEGVRPTTSIPASTGRFDYRVNTYSAFPANLPPHQPRATFTPMVGATPINLGQQVNTSASAQREQVSDMPRISVELATRIVEQLNMFAPHETNPFAAAGHDAVASITFSLGNFTATFDNLSVRDGQIYCTLGGEERSLVAAIRHVINDRASLSHEAKSAIVSAAERIIHARRLGQQKIVSQADLDTLAHADRKPTNTSHDHEVSQALEELYLSDQQKSNKRMMALEQAARQAEAQGAHHLADQIRKNARRSLHKHPIPDHAQRNR